MSRSFTIKKTTFRSLSFSDFHLSSTGTHTMPPNWITGKHGSRCRKNSKPLLYYMYLPPFDHALLIVASSFSTLCHATKLSLLTSLLTNTPLSSPSLVWRRCEKMGNSYFVPGCSILRLGSNRRKKAVNGRVGDAGVSEWLECAAIPGAVEALEQVARELLFKSVFCFQDRLALTLTCLLRSKKTSSTTGSCCC